MTVAAFGKVALFSKLKNGLQLFPYRLLFPRAFPMLPDQRFIAEIVMAVDSLQSNLADLARLDLSRGHGFQQQFRPSAPTGQNSLGGELQMGWQLGIGLEQRPRNFRIVKTRQAFQKLGPKAFRGFLLKQAEKNWNGGIHP